MNNKLLLIKDLIKEIPESYGEDIRNELVSILQYSDPKQAEGNVDRITGLSEHEIRLIKKLSEQTEKLNKLFKEGPNENYDQL